MRGGNNDVGGRLVEMSGAEYMVRGRGYAESTEDIGDIVLAVQREWSAGSREGRGPRGARSRPAARHRGSGTGRATPSTGIVVMRQGENALDVIDRVKAKLHELEPGLPAGRQDRDAPTTGRS